MRVLESSRGLDFAKESVGAQRCGEVGLQYLHGDRAVVLHVPSEIDHRHSTPAELPVDGVTVGEGLSQGFDIAGHTAPKEESQIQEPGSKLPGSAANSSVTALALIDAGTIRTTVGEVLAQKRCGSG